MRRRPFLRAGVAASVGAGFVTTASSGGLARAGAVVPGVALEETDAYEPLGRVDVHGAAEAVVGDDGETAYLAATDGFATVDISDPADPTLLAERRALLEDEDGGPLTEILDVKVDGDRLAVVGPANRVADDEFHGFVLYDVSDPAEPVAATEPVETDYHIHNCYLGDDRLYLVANDGETNPLVVFDVADDDPEEVGRWSITAIEPGWEDAFWMLYYLHDVYVHDELAYLAYWNAGTVLLDVSDPAEPAYRSHVSEVDPAEQRDLTESEIEEARLALPGNDHYSAVDDTGTLLGVGRESWAAEAGDPDGAGGIDLYDVSDPDEPAFRATIEAPAGYDASYYGGQWTTAHNFELRDGFLFSSWYQGGVKIHDVSDPANPEELAWWRDPETAAFWTARVATDDAFVASSTGLVPNASTEGALYTFPIATGEQPDPPSLTEPPTDRADDDETADDETTGAGEPADDGSANVTDTSPNGDADSLPGFSGSAGLAGLAGGALGLEYLRRRRDER